MPDPLPPGSSSSEYFLTKLLVICGIVISAIGALTEMLQAVTAIVPADSQIGKALLIVGLAAAMVSKIAYLVSRTALKATNIKTLADAKAVLDEAHPPAPGGAPTAAKVTLALLLCLGLARAGEPSDPLVYEAPRPPPAGSSVELVWSYSQSQSPGLWVPEAHARDLAAELRVCRDVGAATVKANGWPAYLWVAIGLVVGGAAGYAGARIAAR